MQIFCAIQTVTTEVLTASTKVYLQTIVQYMKNSCFGNVYKCMDVKKNREVNCQAPTHLSLSTQLSSTQKISEMSEEVVLIFGMHPPHSRLHVHHNTLAHSRLHVSKLHVSKF